MADMISGSNKLGLQNSNLLLPKTSERPGVSSSDKAEKAFADQLSASSDRVSKTLSPEKNKYSEKFETKNFDKKFDSKSDAKPDNKDKAVAQNNKPEVKAESKSSIGSPLKPIGKAPVQMSEKQVTLPSDDQTEEITGEEKELESSDNQSAIYQFLVQLKQELNVKPDDVMNAFSDLSEEDLMKSPEANVEKLVSFLDLDPKQQVKAEKMFYQFLKQTESTRLASDLNANEMVLGAEVLTAAELSQRTALNNVDKMNQQFFIDNKAQQIQQAQQNVGQRAPQNNLQSNVIQNGKSQLNAQTSQKSEKEQAAAASAASLPFFSEASAAAKPAPVGALPGASAMSAEAQASVVAPLELQNAEKVEVKPAAKSLDDMKQAAANEAAAMKNEQALAQLNVPQKAVSATVATGYYAAQMNNKNKSSNDDLNAHLRAQSLNQSAAPQTQIAAGQASEMKPVAMDAKSEDASMNMNKDSMADAQYQPVAQDAKPAAAAALGTKAFAVQTAQPTDVEAAKNMKEVVQQARYIAQKGGGEMSIQMTPQGLGEVHLKVAVNNGQVNIEMVTESNEAKKALEKGLSELKSTFAAHRMNVDGIKVDVAQSSSNDLSNQMQQQADRQMANQFLQDFKRGNNQWRNEMFDNTLSKGTRSQINDPADQVYQAAGSKKASNRRLDLVA